MPRTKSPGRPTTPGTAAAAVVVALAVLAVYLLRLDRVAGLIVDDAWYILLGQALARGDGYTLINSPTPGLLPIDPPGFAAILAIVFRLSPQFPQNLWLLKSVSIAAMMGVGVVSYRYFSRDRELPRPLAAGIAAATVLTPAFVFLATSAVMSECVFTLSQLLTVVLIDRSVHAEDEEARLRGTLAGAVLAATTTLIRTAGVALPVAATLYLLKERLYGRALLFAATVMVCLAPWMWYTRTHAPTQAQRLEQGGAHVFTYGDEFWLQWAGDQTSGRISVGELPARIRDNVLDVFGRDVAGIVMPSAFRGANESGEEVVALGGARGLMSSGSMGGARGTMIISFVLSALALVGFVSTALRRPAITEFLVPVSIALILIWPQWSYRFVLPLTPFLFFYLLAGIRTIAPLEPDRVARIVILLVIGLDLFDHARYIVELRDAAHPLATDWAADAQEVDATLEWMREHLGKEAMVATTNPALVYLRTGAKTVAIDDPKTNWPNWKRRGVRYLVSLQPASLPDPSSGRYTVLYRSARQGLWVIEI